VDRLLLAGRRAAPPALLRRLQRGTVRFRWVTLRLSQHRQATELFRSEAWAEAGVRSVVHVPAHGLGSGEAPGPAGVPARTTEARVLLQHCRAQRGVRRLVVVGSAFVYRPVPGNASHADESHALDLDPECPVELRSWIDCDLMFREETREGRLRLVLLRVPAVLGGDGAPYLHPGLPPAAALRVRPAGFDPLVSVVAEDDVAAAVQAALAAHRGGVYNVAADQAVPLSVLLRLRGDTALPVPGPLLRLAGAALHGLGADAWAEGLDGPHLRFGLTLDTRRATAELGFRPRVRVVLPRSGGEWLRLDAAAGPA